MNTQFSININNEVTAHFNAIIKQPLVGNEKLTVIEATKAIQALKDEEHNDFIALHVESIDKMLSMLVDKKWKLNTSERKQILSALVYLIKEDDVIPDDIPGIGLLDDCIVIDLVADKIASQLAQYRAFKKAEKVYSHDDNYNIDDWSVTKRMEKFSRIRNRRLRNNRYR